MTAWYILEPKVAFESRNWLEFPGSSACDGVLASSVQTPGPPALFTNEILEGNISDVGFFLCSKHIHWKEFLIYYAF
jgi:hypothetical protein